MAGKGNKILPSTVFKKGEKRPNQGKRGPSKTPAAIKDMILQALANKGGVAYLEQQADDNPVAFMGLVGNVLPLQITGDQANPLVVGVALTDEQLMAIASGGRVK